MKKLKKNDVRIILGNFNESWARSIFCEAHKIGMVGRKYQWLIMGTYSNRWWRDKSAPCSEMELIEALEGCILTDYLPLASTKVITVSGITPTEYQHEYDLRRGSDYSRFHGYTYDGIWAAALAIQNVAHRIRHFRKNNTIIDFQYRDELWEQLFLEALRNTSFEGVTGPVRFYDNERKANILLKQFQDGDEVKIGEYNGVTEKLDISNDSPITWKDSRGPPKDRTVFVFVHSRVNFAVYSILVVLSIIGILAATIFLIINIRYRNQRYIKMSSPYLNNLIIIGCMLTYISVIFLGLDSSLTSEQTFPYICAARAWLLMAGFSLAFGAMFSKTWRVHSIFTNVKLNKKVIKDYQLFMVVGVLLAIDLGIMTTWQVADPFYRETKQKEPFLDPQSDDIHKIPVNEYCQSDKMTWFVGLIYAYKGLLMIFGAFLAWETRHVSIPALNDSKYVGMSVYNVVLMCIMGAAVSFVLSDEQNYSFAIISVFILFCSTITLCLVFVPKVVELRRNPQGSIDKRIRATLRPIAKPSRESSEMEEQLKDAKTTNQRYRKILQERESELQVLMTKLNTADDYIPMMLHNRSTQENNNQTRKDVPSAVTETTEVSSVCSVLSIVEADPTATLTNTCANQHKKKTTFASSMNKVPSISIEETVLSQSECRTNQQPMNESSSQLSVISSSSLSPVSPNKVISSRRNSGGKKLSSQTVPTRRKSSNGGVAIPTTTAASATTEALPPQYVGSGEDCGSIDTARRTSIPKRATPAFVHQDELWLTQKQCKPRCLLNDSTPPSEEDEEVSTIHRSVSERSHDKCNHHRHHHKHHHHHHHQHSSSSEGSNLKKPIPAHMQSTPNVLGSTVSENELLDLAILPIFQKLLTDRRGAAIASCPNIAIKCDIVEYL